MLCRTVTSFINGSKTICLPYTSYLCFRQLPEVLLLFTLILNVLICGNCLCCVMCFFFFRAHLNDMENIFPFLFLGAIYSMTGPSYAVARLHFLVFFLGRILHSVAYLLALKAPTRSFAYVIAQVPCVSMAIQIILEVASFA